MSPGRTILRRYAALAVAWFMLAQAAAQVNGVLFPQPPLGVCSAASNGSAGQTRSHEFARLTGAMAGHGLCCPLCVGPAALPAPLLVEPWQAPGCLYRLPGAQDVVALVLGREPVQVCVRGPPAPAPA